MTPYKVEFEILLPDGTPFFALCEWLECELHTDSSARCSPDNPLAGSRLQGEPNTVQIHTIGRAEE